MDLKDQQSWVMLYVIVVFLLGYTGLVVTLARIGMVSKYDERRMGPPGPPGAMGPMGEDLYHLSKEGGMTDLSHSEWLLNLNRLIEEEHERSTELGTPA